MALEEFDIPPFGPGIGDPISEPGSLGLPNTALGESTTYYSKIRTIAQLNQFLAANYGIYETLPEKVKNNIDTKTKLKFKLMALGQALGQRSLLDLKNAIDLTQCTEAVLDTYAAMWGIPVPDFYAPASFRTFYKIINSADGVITHEHGVDNNLLYVDFLIDDPGPANAVWLSATSNLANEMTVTIGDLIRLDNPNNRAVFELMMVYRFSFLDRKRLVCQSAEVINDLKGTVAGMMLWVDLLFNKLDANENRNSAQYYPREYPVFRYYSDTEVNHADSWFASNTEDGDTYHRVPTSFTNSYSGNQSIGQAGKADNQIGPRYGDRLGEFWEHNSDTVLTVGLGFDFDESNKIKPFFEKSIKDFFIPFPERYSDILQVTYQHLLGSTLYSPITRW